MKLYKTLLIPVVLVMLLASCSKAHYDVTNVQGVNAEGELLLPVASKSITIGDMITRFGLEEQITWSETGEMAFGFNYEYLEALSGDKMLRFKKWNYEEEFSFDNPFQGIPFPFVDTTLAFTESVTFSSEHVHVMEGVMKSGRLEFMMESNFGNVMRVELYSTDIHDADGNAFMLDIPIQANAFGFELAGLHYSTDTANTLRFNYKIRINTVATTDPELFIKIKIVGNNLAFSEMRGYVDSYSSKDRIDTTFTLFPDNLSGLMKVKGVRMAFSERNTFPLDARLLVDSAMVYSEGMAPYALFEPLPLDIAVPSQMQYGEVYEQTVNGQIDARGGSVLATSEFIVNPGGMSELVTVTDTCTIDARVDVAIPFSFNLDDIVYLDTVNMNLSNLEFPEMIEQLTLQLTFVSTLPLNLDASFFMYDSESGQITDTLLDGTQLIEASYDGRPVTTTLDLDVTEDRIDKVLHSDRIIMWYHLDTDARDVVLNVNQNLDLFLKVKADYNGCVELNK